MSTHDHSNLSRLDRIDMQLEDPPNDEGTWVDTVVATAALVGLYAVLLWGIKPALAFAMTIADALGFL